jgi:hypothetical protein
VSNAFEMLGLHATISRYRRECSEVGINLRPDRFAMRSYRFYAECGPTEHIIDVRHPGWMMYCIQNALSDARDRITRLSGSPNARRTVRIVGSLYFAACEGTMDILVHFDEFPLSPSGDELRFGNALTICGDHSASCGSDLTAQALSEMCTVFDNDAFEYGLCCVADEYASYNIDSTSGGCQAVGLDVSRVLPGLYWGNYFGSFLCDHIGRDVVLATPGCVCFEIESGIILANKESPERWCLSEFQINRCQAVTHLGEDLFFVQGRPMCSRLFTPL